MTRASGQPGAALPARDPPAPAVRPDPGAPAGGPAGARRRRRRGEPRDGAGLVRRRPRLPAPAPSSTRTPVARARPDPLRHRAGLAATARDGVQRAGDDRPRCAETARSAATDGCLLYGYGAYEAVPWPEFAVGDAQPAGPRRRVRGGARARRRRARPGLVAGRAGCGARQNTFDDFVAARDALVEAGLGRARARSSRAGCPPAACSRAAVYSRAPRCGGRGRRGALRRRRHDDVRRPDSR